MAFTFPLPLADFFALLKVRRVRFDLARFEQDSGTAIGQVIRSRIAAPKWTAEIQLPPMSLADARRARALLRAVADFGSAGTFHIYNPEVPYPAQDPTGSIIGSSTVTILDVGSGSLRLTGLPAGYDISIGDFLSVSGGAYRSLLQVSEDIAASGSGVTGFVSVTPLRSWMAAGNAVDLKKPVARMCLLSYDVGTSEIMLADGVSFTAIEVR